MNIQPKIIEQKRKKLERIASIKKYVFKFIVLFAIFASLLVKLKIIKFILHVIGKFFKIKEQTFCVLSNKIIIG